MDQPSLGTDSIVVESTAVSKGHGTECLVFPGTRKRRWIGAIQISTEKKDNILGQMKARQQNRSINFMSATENKTKNQ